MTLDLRKRARRAPTAALRRGAVRFLRSRRALMSAVLAAAVVAIAGVPNLAHAQGGFFDRVVNNLAGIFLALIDLVFVLILWLLGVLLSLAGKYVDLFLSVRNLAGAPTVVEFWTFTRDALNFVFILALLAIAFATIAGLEQYGMRDLLPRLLFAALLVNFSLAIAGAFLQVANVLCTAAIRGLPRAQENAACGQQFTQFQAGEGPGTSLSQSLAEVSLIKKQYTFGAEGLGTIFGLKTFAPSGGITNIKLGNTPDKNFGTLVHSVIATIVVAIFTTSMIVLALMLGVRLAMLLLLLVLAPVPYAFSIIPRAGAYGEKWWGTFIQYTFFLPAVVFFLVLAIRMVESGGGQSGIFQQLLGVQPRGVLGASVFDLFNTFFISVFMVVSVFIAKTMGLIGAQAALSAARTATTGAVRLGAAPGLFAGRLAGRGAAAAGGAAARGLGTAIAGTRVGGALRGARTFGRAAQRLGTGETAAAQIEAQQKPLKGRGKQTAMNALYRGSAGGAAEALDQDYLESERDFQTALQVAPQDSALSGKVKKAYGTKFAVSAAHEGDTELSHQSLTSALGAGGAGLTPAQLAKISGKAKDTRESLKKMKEEDIGKNQVQIRAAILASIEQVQRGAGVSDLAVDLTPGKIRAYSQRLDQEGQQELERLLQSASASPAGLNKAQEAAAKRAGYSIP